MLEYVIDTNVVMSMLISGKAHYRAILSYYKFYLPEFSLSELEEYKSVIFEKTKFTEAELKDFVYFTFSSISVIPSFGMGKDSFTKAKAFCDDIDIKDVSFLALAIDMNLMLLTRDEPLYKGLKKKGFRNVMLFKDFLNLI